VILGLEEILMPSETITRSGSVLPVQIRAARKRYACDDCYQPIEPGDRYELSVSPPHRIQEYDVDYWLTWRTHYPRHDGLEFLPGCHEAAAYREKAARDAAGCPVMAEAGTNRYPCRSHEGGVHHFAAHWPACPAPFCKLPPDHRGLHDIPPGSAEVVDTSA
jgi:hypothetical protein